VQLESIISRPITLCPPSISANSTDEAILSGASLTGLQGLRGPLSREPAQATAGATAAAEVAVKCHRNHFKSSSKRRSQHWCCSQYHCRSQWRI